MTKHFQWVRRPGAAVWLAAALALLAGLALAGVARAQDGTPGPVTDDEVNRVAKQLFCPVCENVPLDVCPTQACKQWRATIREKIAAGWDEQQIKDYFAQQYGERVLAEPSTRGLNVLVWVIPPVLVAGGAFFLWRLLRRMTSAGAPAEPQPAAPSSAENDDYVKRLEQELERRR